MVTTSYSNLNFPPYIPPLPLRHIAATTSHPREIPSKRHLSQTCPHEIHQKNKQIHVHSDHGHPTHILIYIYIYITYLNIYIHIYMYHILI